MQDLSRRRFLGLAAGSAAVAAASACGSSPGGGGRPSSSNPPAPPSNGSAAPFDHVVLLTMENRSFDHLLGWFPGANGKQAGLSYQDRAGDSVATWDLGTDYQGC
ncbi:MAG: alkaline phosphatase family protein, partial [Frankiaceae bacterium]